MTSCMREKDECSLCRHNHNGYCSVVGKNIDELQDKWYKQRKYKINKKLKENKERFWYEDFIELLNNIPPEIYNAEDVYSKNSIEWLNKMMYIMSDWKAIDTKYIFQENYQRD